MIVWLEECIRRHTSIAFLQRGNCRMKLKVRQKNDLTEETVEKINKNKSDKYSSDQL